MAKPVQRKARKDYLDNGIKKGELYWFVSIKTGPRSSRVMRQIAPFRRSQLTTSEFLSSVYSIEEQLQQVSCVDDARDLANELRELGEEEQQKFENMPEGLQQGETGQLLEARSTGCEEAACEIESFADEFDPDDDDEDAKTEDDVVQDIQNVVINYE